MVTVSYLDDSDNKGPEPDRAGTEEGKMRQKMWEVKVTANKIRVENGYPKRFGLNGEDLLGYENTPGVRSR